MTNIIKLGPKTAETFYVVRQDNEILKSISDWTNDLNDSPLQGKWQATEWGIMAHFYKVRSTDPMNPSYCRSGNNGILNAGAKGAGIL